MAMNLKIPLQYKWGSYIHNLSEAAILFSW